MKLWLYTIFALVLLSTPVWSVSATVSCGTIIGPNNIYNSPPITTKAITNCTDPFAVTTSPAGNYQVVVDGMSYQDGAVIVVPSGGVTSVFATGTPTQMQFNQTLYRHDGDDYQYIDQSPVGPTSADYLAYAAVYFTEPADVTLYQNIFTLLEETGDAATYFYTEDGSERIDATTGDTVSNRYYEFINAFEGQFQAEPPRIPAGTYTYVITEYSIYVNYKSLWDTVRDFILPTAFAQFTENYTYTVTFTLTESPPEPARASNVLFLPGIQASRLYTAGILGTEDQIWEPDGNQDVRQLAMNAGGVSVNSVYTKDILGKAYGVFGTYAGFSTFMNRLVQDDVIAEWSPYAYDWRYSVDDVVGSGTQYKTEIKRGVDEIVRLASSSYSGQVTIVGHSNGGLLAKALMTELEKQRKSYLIDTVVFLAVPQLGTPKAIASILHGYGQEQGFGYLIDDEVARGVIKNMPGAYGLVPSQNYFTVASGSVVQFDTSTSTGVFRTAYGTVIDSVAELGDFMSGIRDNRPEATTTSDALRANSTLLQKSLALHNDVLDSWRAPAGVKVVEVIGTGLDTVKAFEYRGYSERVCGPVGPFLQSTCVIKDLYKPVPIFSSYGDKTVVGESAGGYSGAKEEYFIDLDASDAAGGLFSVEHYNITENPSIQTLLINILTSTSSTIDFITSSNPTTESNRLVFGAHSPVTLEVRDSKGRKVGRTVVQGVAYPTEEIPGSTYLELGGSTYIVVPDGTRYDVVLHGTAQGGVTFSLDTLRGGVQQANIAVSVATITPSTTISLSYATSSLSNLSIDQNGDGSIDQVLTPQGVDVTPKVSYKMLRDTVQALSLMPIRKAPLLLLVAAAEALDKNPKLVVVEVLSLKQLDTLIVTYQKNKWITQSEGTTLRGIINKLK